MLFNTLMLSQLLPDASKGQDLPLASVPSAKNVIQFNQPKNVLKPSQIFSEPCPPEMHRLLQLRMVPRPLLTTLTPFHALVRFLEVLACWDTLTFWLVDQVLLCNHLLQLSWANLKT